MSALTRDATFRQVWRGPLAVAALSALGLVAALVGDGAWDAVSWLALAPPIMVSGVAWRRSRVNRGHG